MKQPPLPRTLYLVVRPDHYGEHFHPSNAVHRVLLCTEKDIAFWEAGWTGDGASIWTRDSRETGGGFLIERWNGLDIDYGHIVRGGELPDGSKLGFYHEHAGGTPWEALPSAVWWSNHRLPDWLHERGVRIPDDDRSRSRIEQQRRGSPMLSWNQCDKRLAKWEKYVLPWAADADSA